MKKILFFSFILVALASCKQKDYVTLDVKLDNLEANDTLMMVYGKMFKKEIKRSPDGTFKDTLKVPEAGFYGLVFKNSQIQAFLKNGFDMKVNGDAKDVTKTVTFSGKGSQNNTYLVERVNNVKIFNDSLEGFYQLDSAQFHAKINAFETKMTNLLTGKIDTTLVRMEKTGLSGYVMSLKQNYSHFYQYYQKMGKGKPSPAFVDYENYNGGKTSLEDFKGKFVYIDIWATWCQPCLKEIPSLLELEEAYKGKNIAFVSISSDRKEDYAKWKAMVKEKALGGTQLYIGEDMTFMQAYEVSSIPRFILIDPNGNIVDANAPRPSDKEKIEKLFTEAGI